MKYPGLGYLHDVDVENFTYSISTSKRLVIQTAKAPDDLGYAPWNGKRLKISLIGIAWLNFNVPGPVAGPDGIDSWGENLSDGLAAQVEEHQQLFGSFASVVRCRIALRSGSVVEVVCKEIIVETGD